MSFALIAPLASSNEIGPRMVPALATRNHMVNGHVTAAGSLPAVAASVPVAQHNCIAGWWGTAGRHKDKVA